MTPLQLARAECANHEHDGSCLGAHIGDKGLIGHCSPKPRCVLSAGERCAYFEECIAPMAAIVKEPRRAKAIHAAVHSYRMAHTGVVMVRHARQQGGQRGSLASQRPRQGGCLPLQRRQNRNPYKDSGCSRNEHATVECGASAAAMAGRGAEA